MFDIAFKGVYTFDDFRTELVEGKEKRAGTELVQEITKEQKVEDEKEITKLKQLMKIIPNEEEVAIDAIPLAVKSRNLYVGREEVSPCTTYTFNDVGKHPPEKKYPLTPPTLSMMLEKKLQIDYESEMAYQLCKLITKQLKNQ
ncbi:hypothetical protein Tco_1192150 [Tanacetum coccineum]